jgi:hypothetical protein
VPKHALLRPYRCANLIPGVIYLITIFEIGIFEKGSPQRSFCANIPAAKLEVGLIRISEKAVFNVRITGPIQPFRNQV